MSAVDLFVWREEAEAAQRVAQAEVARAEAIRKLRVAPRGKVRMRQALLVKASTHALRAAVELARIQREGPSS